MQNTKLNTLDFPVSRTILTDIVQGRLRRGERVCEQTYSRRCQVSRTPVRQALRVLWKLKVIDLKDHKGARVQMGASQARKVLSAEQRHNPAQPLEPAFVRVAHRIKTLLASHNRFRAVVIKDAAIAHLLKVSRTTAHRALALLSSEGLLQPLPRRGWKRTVLGPHEILDLYEMRLALEPVALASAWNKFDRKAIQDLYARSQAAATSRGLARLSETDMIELDLELHNSIARSSDNLFLRHALEQHDTLRRIAIAPDWRISHRSKATFQEHALILKYILKNRRNQAVAALRQHLLKARDGIKNRIEKNELLCTTETQRTHCAKPQPNQSSTQMTNSKLPNDKSIPKPE